MNLVQGASRRVERNLRSSQWAFLGNPGPPATDRELRESRECNRTKVRFAPFAGFAVGPAGLAKRWLHHRPQNRRPVRVTLNMMAEPGMFGMKRYTLELAKALPALGVHPVVRRSRRIEVRLGRLRVGGLVTSRLRNWVPVRRRDLLHATDHKSNPHLPPADVVTVHDLIPMERPELVDDPALSRRDGKEALRAVATAKRLIVPTQAVKDTLVRRLDAASPKVHVVPNGLDHATFHPPLADEPRDPAYVGGRLNVLVAMNAERRKRVDLACEAAADLPFVRVVHIGSGHRTARDRLLHDRLAVATRRLAAEGRYVHLGKADDARLRSLYAGADVVVHPSAAEGFGLPPLEALACGARVLASDIAPHREVLGDAARFVALDAAAIARELAAAWDGEAVRDARFPAAQQRLDHSATFTWERTARGTLDAYREALNGEG